MIDVIVSGGPIMVPLILCAILAIGFIFERIIVLGRVPGHDQAEDDLAEVERILSQEGEDAVANHCSNGKGVLNYVFSAIMKRYDALVLEQKEFERTRRKLVELSESSGFGDLGKFLAMQKELGDMRDELVLEIDEAGSSYLGRYLSALNTINHVAPLLGLLGTIVGMIIAFRAIAVAGTGDPKVVAGGISQALVTTATGLTIAIPGIVAYRYLARKAEDAKTKIEVYAHAFANSLMISNMSKL